MQSLSKTLSVLLGIAILLLGWSVFELTKAKRAANLAMDQAEMANQRIDRIVEKMLTEQLETATT